MVKEEYRGKITYKEGDFLDESPEDHLVIGMVLSNRENEKNY